MPTGSNRRGRGRLFSRSVLEPLETRTLLTNTAPVLDAINAVTMLAAASASQMPKTFQVPLTATDADGDTLTYTVTSSNSDIAPILHTGDPFLKMTVQIGAGVAEVQTLKGTATATAGTYTLSFGGNTTNPLAYSSTITAVQAALRLLPGLANVIVGGSPLTSTSGMTFTFPVASGNVEPITIGATSLTPATGFAVTETTRGIVPGGTGDMWLLLYKEWAPLTVRTMIGLVNAGFYDNLIFHRVIKGFMAQGGDPLGTGTGGPGFQFADEFNPNLIFSNRGLLAMANSGDDTNGSQFFITDVATRHLDFNHTIWGQLVRGFDTLDAIVNSPVSGSTPTPDGSLKIVSAEIVPNLTDTAITLSARQAGTSTITVTVNDGQGGVSTRTFQATATADTNNTPAYLKNVPDLYTPVDQPISIPLYATDLERDALAFSYGVTSAQHATFIMDGSTLMVTPEPGYTGIISVVLRASRAVNDSAETDLWDTQTITIAVGGKPIHAASPGYSAIAGTQRTAYVTTFTCDDAALDAGSFTATISWGDATASVTGEIVKSGSLFTVRGTHTYAHPGEYPLKVTITRTTSGVQTGSVTSVQAVAKVAPAAPDAQTVRTILNAGGPIVARFKAAFSQYGSVSSTGSTVTATVNWGDGAAVAPLALDSNGNFRLSHAYKNVGKYYILITVNDGSGTPVVQRVLVNVLKTGPKAIISGDKTGLTGQNRAFLIRSSDTGSNIPAANYWYSVDWGDGTPAQTTTLGTAGLAHRYWKAGTFKATIRSIDPWGGTGTVTSYPVTIVNAMVQPDPFVAGRQAVFVGGTRGNDRINITAGKKKGEVVVAVNGKTLAGKFAPTGLIYMWGYDGNDTITVASNVIISGVFYGGAGNDTLTGGAASSILVGGDGDDTLRGGAQRSLLIGGTGADKLTGRGNDDILVGGRTTWDDPAQPQYIPFLLREWAATGTAYAARIGHLDGTATDGLNSGINLEYRTVSSVLQQTVFDDGVIDSLTGGGGADWFLANQTDVVADAAKKDSITDKTDGEQVLNVLT